MVVDAAATPTLASNIGPAKTGPLAPALKNSTNLNIIILTRAIYFEAFQEKQLMHEFQN